MSDFKRSPHKARLSHNAANVLARNLRIQLAQEFCFGELPHQECLGIVARMAGYDNLHHLAANYTPDAPDAPEIDARTALAGRPIEDGMDTDAWIAANLDALHPTIIAAMRWDKNLAWRGRDWFAASRVLRGLGTTPTAFTAIACILGAEPAATLSAFVRAWERLETKGLLVAREAARRDTPWLRYFFRAMLTKEMNAQPGARLVKTLPMHEAALQIAIQLLAGEPLTEMFGDDLLAEVCAALHAVARAEDAADSALDHAFQHLSHAFPRHAQALSIVRRDASVDLAEAVETAATPAKQTMAGMLLVIYGATGTGRSTRARSYERRSDESWHNAGEIREPRAILTILEHIHATGVVANIHAADAVGACNALLKFAALAGVALDHVTLRFEAAPLHKLNATLHMTPRQWMNIMAARSVEGVAKIIAAGVTADPTQRFVIHTNGDVDNMMKVLHDRFPAHAFTAMDGIRLGFSPMPGGKGAGFEEAHPLIMVLPIEHVSLPESQNVQHIMFAA